MNRSVPWSSRSGGLGAREIAEEAARRQRMSLGEWLDTVVTDQPSETESEAARDSERRRRDAVIDRLRDPGGPSRDERGPARRTESRGRRRDVEEDVPEPRFRNRSQRERTRRDDYPEDRSDRRGRRGARLEDIETMLDDTLEDVDRRATRAQRRTDGALADLADLLRSNEHHHESNHELFGELAGRLKAIEGQLVVARAQTVPPPPVNAPAVQPADRLGLERTAAPAEPTAAAQMQRLESKLNSVLVAVSAAKAERPHPKAPIAGHILREAVGEIAERQRELGESGALGPLAARLQQRRHAPVAERSETALALAQVQREVAGLAAKLDEVKREVVAPVGRRPGEDALGRIRDEIAAMSQGLSELAPRRSITALETTLATLSRQIEATQGTHVREENLQDLARLVQDLRQSLASADTRPALGGLEQEVMKIGSRLDRLAASGIASDAVAHIQSQTEEIRNLLAAASAHPLPFERIETEIAALTRRLERGAAVPAPEADHRRMAEIRSLIHETSEPALQDIRARIDALTGKVGEAIERASGERYFTELSRRLDSVQQKIAAPASGDVQSLAAMVGALADNLETARQPYANSETMQALQTQIAKLSERLDRADSTFEAITTLQHSVTELFGQLEATRRVTEDATQSLAPADSADHANLDAALAQEITELRSLQDQADRRSHATLNAVHGTLQKVVERLARLEDDAPAQSVETLALGPAPVFAPGPATKPMPPKADAGFVANLLRGRPAIEGSRPAPAVEDMLIEPGMAFKGGADGGPANGRATAPALDIGVEPEVATGRNNFIAAARRAAQTAQKEADTLEARQAAPAKDGAGRRAFDGRKRVIMLSLAALFVIAGAYAVMRGMSEQAPRQAVSRAAQSKPIGLPTTSKVQTSDAGLLSPSALPKRDVASLPIAGSDPIVTASIGPKAAEPLVLPPILAAPAIVPAANLRAAAEAGMPGAQYELATRYAEGRQLPRDLKLAAQWYEKAALQGLAPAEYRLGSMYEKGLGLTRDLARAKTWYQKAADAGNARAMHNLAVLTAEGTDNKPDYTDAAVWFRKAAELGVRDSQYNLAVLLARGLGQPVNLVQSYVWFAAAAAQGDADAGKKRDDIAARLDAKDMAAARTIADSFKPRPLDRAANEVAMPSGGWDAAMPAAAAGKPTKPKISAL